MKFELLKRLSEAHGVPGQEDAIRSIVRQELDGICEFSSDTMGNLICLKRATKPGSGPSKKVMIAAHMDEIGFVVRYLDDKGFLRLHALGGFDTRQLASQRVIVHTREGQLKGTLMLGTKPKHLLGPDEGNKPAKIDDFFVDLGLSGDEVKAQVRIGDMVTLDRDCRPMGKLVTGKAMDNRVAVYTMIEALRSVGDHEVDIYGVATVQEEIGLRGAIAAGSGLNPDVVIAVDITLANDIPGLTELDHITKLGEGTAIKILDSSLICSPKLVAHFRDLAEKHSIKHQMELLPMGGTDAGGVQRLNGGVAAFTLSVPCRYVHTVNETIHPDDLDASVALLARYLEDAHSRSYVYEA